MLRRTLSIITISVVVALVGVLGLSLVAKAQSQSQRDPVLLPGFMEVAPGGR